jgi:hypothetical protein
VSHLHNILNLNLHLLSRPYIPKTSTENVSGMLFQQTRKLALLNGSLVRRASLLPDLTIDDTCANMASKRNDCT